MAEADFSAEEEQQRRWYVHWLLSWNQGPLVEASELVKLPTLELARCFVAMQQARMLGNIEWGAENAAVVLPEQREAIIDAMVGLDTGGRFGTEPVPPPSAGGCLDEAPIFWAAARRKYLERLPPDELAVECRNVLAKHAGGVDLHQKTMEMAHAVAQRRMRAVVGIRYYYTESLAEAAKHFRDQGMKANDAARHLGKNPYCCTNGTTVSFEKERFVVKRGGSELGSVGEQQFYKRYWPAAKKFRLRP